MTTPPLLTQHPCAQNPVDQLSPSGGLQSITMPPIPIATDVAICRSHISYLSAIQESAGSVIVMTAVLSLCFKQQERHVNPCMSA